MGKSRLKVSTDSILAYNMNDNLMKDFINTFNWTYAKTYAQICPHEYIVKDKIDEKFWESFTEVVRYIREKGRAYKVRWSIYYNKFLIN